MHKKIIGACLFALSISAANATAITGAIDSDPGDGLIGGGGWSDGNASISYSVKNRGGSWIYDYMWSTTQADLTHLIVETSETFKVENVLPGSTPGWELGWFERGGNDNPGIPAPIYGVKFFGEGMLDVFRLISDAPPMWGDMYAKDGKNGKDEVFAYNASFGLTSDALIEGMAPPGFILVPDTVSAVPEPSSLAMFGIGGFMILLSVLGETRRNRKAVRRI